MSLIEMNSICKSYRNIDFETQVLKDITLHINEGDYISIIGPSGSGKSTLMAIAGCLSKPTSGEYILDGEEMHNLSDYTKKEADNFLNSLSTQQFKEIQTFFDTMPKLKHEMTAKCTVCGKENERVLEGMGDFFL